MRIMLVTVLSLLLISGIAMAKPDLEKPVKSFDSPLLATEVEPNDDSASANVLTAGDPMDAAIDPAGDVDFFAFTVAAGDIVAFETHAGDAGDTKLYLFDVDGVTQLAYNDDGGAGFYSLISYTFTAAGTFFVEVTGYSSSTQGTYVLTATLEDPPPPAPDNDVCTGAIDLQEQGLAIFDVDLADGGYTHTDNLVYPSCTGYSAPGPEAFYKLFMMAGETFTVEEAGTCDMALYLFTDCADPMASCVAGADAGSPEVLSYTADADGWFFLAVDTYSASGCPVTVTIAEPVGTEDASFGSIKSMYR